MNSVQQAWVLMGYDSSGIFDRCHGSFPVSPPMEFDSCGIPWGADQSANFQIHLFHLRQKNPGDFEICYWTMKSALHDLNFMSFDM